MHALGDDNMKYRTDVTYKAAEDLLIYSSFRLQKILLCFTVWMRFIFLVKLRFEALIDQSKVPYE